MFAVFAVGLFLTAPENREMLGDEGGYTAYGARIVELTWTGDFGDRIWTDPVVNFVGNNPKFGVCVIGAAWKIANLFGDPILALRLFMTLMEAAAAAWLFAMLARTTGIAPAWIGAALLVIHPVIACVQGAALLEAPMLALVAGALLLLTGHDTWNARRWRAVAFGVVAGLAIATRLHAAVLLAWMLFARAGDFPADRRKTAETTVLACAAALVAFIAVNPPFWTYPVEAARLLTVAHAERLGAGAFALAGQPLADLVRAVFTLAAPARFVPSGAFPESSAFPALFTAAGLALFAAGAWRCARERRFLPLAAFAVALAQTAYLFARMGPRVRWPMMAVIALVWVQARLFRPRGSGGP